eukprot:Opistho-2@20145
MTSAIANQLLGYTNTQASKVFLSLIRAIGEAKSKYEEDRIIVGEIALLKERIGLPDVTPRQMREYLVRLVYCDMLGHDASFGYIHAVKYAQSTALSDKKVGYLAVCLLLHEDHELMILLINTLQRDLKSNNMLEVCAALTAVCRLANAEMVPALLPLVESRLTDQREAVRKKAVLALQRMHSKAPTIVSGISEQLRRALCDKDPSVMGASLNAFHELAILNPSTYRDVTPSFVTILKQIIDHRLSREYEYHGVPAPWMQIKLLKILAVLGADDPRTSEKMYEILAETLRRAEGGSHVGYAVVYECIQTITTIYPSPPLIEMGARTLDRFLRSTNNNLKYLGITALAAIVQVEPRHAAQHQLVVIDCLDDPDETLKRKTLDLLYRMTNPSNVNVIVDRMVSFMRATPDAYIRADLFDRVNRLAERFAPDNIWFLETMVCVLEIAGEVASADVAYNLLRLIAEGSDNENADAELKARAVEVCAGLVARTTMPDVLVKVMVWVLGEYGIYSGIISPDGLVDALCEWLDKPFISTEARGWIVSALTKVVAQLGSVPPIVLQCIEKHSHSASIDTQQRCRELLELSEDMGVMATMLPVDASCEDLEVDPDLGFLDHFVAEALASGAQRYLRPDERAALVPQSESRVSLKDQPKPSSLNFEPYDAPVLRQPHVAPATFEELRQSSTASASGVLSQSNDRPLAAPDAAVVREELSIADIPVTNVKRVWGRQGYAKDDHISANRPDAHSSSHVDAQSTASASTIAALPTAQTPRASTDAPVAWTQPALTDAATPAERKRHELASALFSGVASTGASSAVSSTATSLSNSANAGSSSLFRSKSGDTSSKLLARQPQQATTQPQQATAVSLPSNSAAFVNVTAASAGSTARSGGSHVTSASGSSFAADLGLLVDYNPTHVTAAAQQPQHAAPTLLSSGGTAIGGTVGIGGIPSYGSASVGKAAPLAVGIGASGGVFVAPPPAQPLSSLQPHQTVHLTQSARTGLYSSSMNAGGGLSGGIAGDLLSLSIDDAVPSGAPLLPASQLHTGTTPRPQSSTSLAKAPSSAEVASFVPDRLRHYPRGDMDQEASNDGVLRVSYCKVWADTSLALAFQFANIGQSNIRAVRISVAVPTGLQLLRGDGFDAGEIEEAIITAGSKTRRVFGLSFSGFASSYTLSAKVTYTDDKGASKFSNISLALPISDIMRPARLTTADFGAKWPTLAGAERRQTISGGSVRTASELLDRAKGALKAHAVEMIGEEGLAAAKILQTQHVMLLHGKVSGQQSGHLSGHRELEVLVRSPDIRFTEAVVRQCAVVFK